MSESNPQETSTAAESSAETGPEALPAAEAASAGGSSENEAIPAEFLQMLVCPLTRSRLVQDGEWLIAQTPDGAGLRYPIRAGIPVLLVDEAQLPEGVGSLDEFKQRYRDSIPA